MAQHQIKWNFENQMMQSKTILDLCLWCNTKVVIIASFQLIWVTTHGPTSNQVKFSKSNDAIKNYAWFTPMMQYKSCDLRKFSTDLSDNRWPNIKSSEIFEIKWCNQKLCLIYAYDAITSNQVRFSTDLSHNGWPNVRSSEILKVTL